MMRPVSLALPPIKPDGFASSCANVVDKKGKVVGQNVKLTWTDNSITETAFVVKRTTDGTTWTDVDHLAAAPGKHQHPRVRTYTDTTSNATTAYKYQVVAENIVGYGSGHAVHDGDVDVRTRSASTSRRLRPDSGRPHRQGVPARRAPRVNLTWQDTATAESAVHRSSGPLTTVRPSPSSPLSAAKSGTGAVAYADTTVVKDTAYVYRVAAQNLAGTSSWSNTADGDGDAPPATPVIATGACGSSPAPARLTPSPGLPCRLRRATPSSGARARPSPPTSPP